jgi:hypothetical protein
MPTAHKGAGPASPAARATQDWVVFLQKCENSLVALEQANPPNPAKLRRSEAGPSATQDKVRIPSTNSDAPPYRSTGRGKCLAAVLREPSLHLLDLRPLSRDDLFGKFLHLRVLAELKHDFGHRNRPFMMGNHALGEIDIGIA